MEKILAFDLEIVKDIPEGVNWKDVRPLGISCASVLDNAKPLSYLYFHHDENYNPISGDMTKQELIDMLERLIAFITDGYKILSWNGLSFDFAVLAEESGMYDECKELALNHIDMMFHFFCIKGYMLGLDTAAHGLGLQGKLPGMSGAKAPILWASPDLEDRLKVLRYVHQDAVSTLEVYEESIKQKGIKWISKSGRANVCWIPDGWKTVKECLELPLPDQSWMDKPIPREHFMEWINE